MKFFRLPIKGEAEITIRNPWLDFLRAAAITAVLIHHVGQSWPINRPWLHQYTSIGAEGVDLFFVLSGWLIGGLFWREHQKSGKVNLLRFWMRRWWRTIPPYAGGLLLAWIAVWYYRHEPFDPGYLLFLQNYYQVMPFFLISWSLCIEEHFYLFVPLIFFLVKSQPRIYLLILALLPFIFRYFEYDPQENGFGYALTASHLYCDGMVLGFSAAYINTYHQSALERIRPLLILVAILAFIILLLDIGEKFEYIFNPLLIALVFLGGLVSIVHHSKNEIFRNIGVAWLAKISYSVYLTHALVIHVFTKKIYPQFGMNETLALSVQIALILFSGWVFHLVFERSSFILRERWVPVRSES